MAHLNEREYLRQFLAEWPVGAPGRVLNLGSAEYDAPMDYRPLFPDRALLGVDLAAGRGVDVVCDITGDCAALEGEQFAAVLCCSVLEHCAQPWIASRNIEEKCLAPNGLVYVTIPWIWRYHPYPKDYWRMSEDGVRQLFPRIAWKRCAYFSQAPNERVPLAQSSDPPWRFEGPRVYLSSQMLCMIGRLA